ncbi:MAG: oxetanocin [Blastocatellia bacterium]|nr:MAG: oxetanocin [Blastocatellia bacterium]
MSSLLKTLVELERLKRLERTGWTLRGLPNSTESVGAHSFGVCVTAMLLADECVSRGVKVDLEKTLRIALLHDWSEVRVGDMPRTATSYFGAETRKRAETAAFGDVVDQLGSSSNYKELYQDYEERRSIEARLVKASDVIDLLVEALALERAGHRGLDEFWEVTGQRNFQLDGVPQQVVNEVLDSLMKARTDLQIAPLSR